MELSLLPEEYFLAKKIKKTNKYIYMCRVSYTLNKTFIETRYFRDYSTSFYFAKTRKFADSSIGITVDIYVIPFEQPESTMELVTTVNN